MAPDVVLGTEQTIINQQILLLLSDGSESFISSQYPLPGFLHIPEPPSGKLTEFDLATPTRPGTESRVPEPRRHDSKLI